LGVYRRGEVVSKNRLFVCIGEVYREMLQSSHT